MIITYTLNENDLLIHQLFIASKSERIQKKRKRSRVIIPLLYGVFGLGFFYDGSLSMMIAFFVAGILWFFIYPIWERRHYVKHYKGFINENQREMQGKTITLELHKDFILTKDSGSESKVSSAEIKEIWEIPTTIFIRLKGGHTLLVPKDKLNNVGEVKAILKDIALYLNINYETDNLWKWE